MAGNRSDRVTWCDRLSRLQPAAHGHGPRRADGMQVVGRFSCCFRLVLMAMTMPHARARRNALLFTQWNTPRYLSHVHPP